MFDADINNQLNEWFARSTGGSVVVCWFSNRVVVGSNHVGSNHIFWIADFFFLSFVAGFRVRFLGFRVWG